MEHAQVVSDYIDEEVKAGRVLLVGHKDNPRVKNIHLSPVRVIPKKSKTNKWRNLSNPYGIVKKLASLLYVSVDAVISGIVF